MGRYRPRGPLAADREEWLRQFEDELKKVRPHVGQRVAYTLALQKYDAKRHPCDLARQYGKALKAPEPAPAKKRK